MATSVVYGPFAQAKGVDVSTRKVWSLHIYIYHCYKRSAAQYTIAILVRYRLILIPVVVDSCCMLLLGLLLICNDGKGRALFESEPPTWNRVAPLPQLGICGYSGAHQVRLRCHCWWLYHPKKMGAIGDGLFWPHYTHKCAPFKGDHKQRTLHSHKHPIAWKIPLQRDAEIWRCP